MKLYYFLFNQAEHSELCYVEPQQYAVFLICFFEAFQNGDLIQFKYRSCSHGLCLKEFGVQKFTSTRSGSDLVLLNKTKTVWVLI